jgi:predicted negative regulator of RcsB-dependent stress response
MDDRPSLLRPAIDQSLVMSDSDLFWQEHWKKFVWGLVGLVLLILAVGAWKFRTAATLSSAEALYSAASGADGWREVVQKYPGTAPAGNAQVRLAESFREAGDVASASGELENLLASQPEHPLAGAAWLTLGELRQMQNNPDGALEAFRTASSRYKASYAAPLALLAEANLLKTRGSGGEARAVLQSVGSLHPGTPAAMVAEAELARLVENPAPAAVPAN